MKIGWFVLAGICLLMFTGMINAQDPEPEAEAEAPAEPEAEAPAEPEVEAPAEAPAEPEAEAPAEAPAEPEAEAPAEAPAEPEAEAPAEAPAEPEAEAPAEAPAEPEAEAPAEAPAEPEAEAPAEAPAEPEAEAPAEPEAEAPADAAAEADDQYVADDTGDDEFSDGGDAVIVTAQPAAATEADAVTDADAVTVPEVVTTPEVTTIEATTEPPTTVVPTTEEPSLLGIQYPDCPNYTLIHDDSRHFSVELARDAEGSADNGTSGWVSYGYSGQPAIIPTQCISMDQCGTRMPFWVDLEDQVMPEVHEETITAKLCASFVVMGKEACCIFYNDVEIFQCHNITLYNHSIQPDVLGRSCVQGAEENITEALENMKECILPGSSLEDIEDNQFDNAITFVIDEDTPMAACNFDENLRTLLALELNSLIPNVTTAAPTTEATTSDQVTVKVQDGITAANTPEQRIDDGDTDADVRGPEGRRRRRSAGNEPYTADCVKYIQPSPKMVDGKMQIYAYVQCEGEDPVDQDQVYEAGSVMQDKQDPSGNPDEQWTHAPMTVERGVHPDMVPASQTAADGTVWDRHKGLLITIIVILIIILIILLIGCMCLKCQKCCDRCCPCCAPSDSHRLERGDGDHRKQPLVQENPITDREMMKGEEPMVKSAPKKSAPLKSAPPPRNTATKEDDNNGYIVPLDQVTQDTKF